jgi:hypothetical protein
MELVRRADGEGDELRLLNTVPNQSSLTGRVRKPRRGGDGITTLRSITGSAGVQMRLPSTFQLGSVSAKVVDALLASGMMTGLLRMDQLLGRMRLIELAK